MVEVKKRNKSSRSTTEHKAKSPIHLNFALLTISTSRYRKIMIGEVAENPSGKIIANLVQSAGHKLVYSAIVSDERNLIKKTLERIVKMPEVDVVITCGGTGITKTDITIETITPLLNKDLPGFGEIFRKLSYDDLGSSAIMTRATAGLINGKAIFCLPGSPQAVETALTSLVIPEARHIVKHARE